MKAWSCLVLLAGCALTLADTMEAEPAERPTVTCAYKWAGKCRDAVVN